MNNAAYLRNCASLLLESQARRRDPEMIDAAPNVW
jgi:hypothetical protein